MIPSEGMNLRLLQISDSALPIGGYTHSWGLEAAVARGLVSSAPTLEGWTGAWLRFTLGPAEGVVVASACRAASSPESAGASLQRANDLLRAILNPPSVRTASREMGERLLELAATWDWSAAGVARLLGPLAASAAPRGERGWHHAVVFGVLGALSGATARDTLAAFLHQAALGMIAAALRALPIGHTHGQQVLAYLHADIDALATDLAGRDLESAGSAAPFHEVLCDEQTRLYTRLFRS
jgi:urease accessory protein